MANPVNERRLKDASLIKPIALPNAAATVSTASIDLGATTPFPVGDQFSVQVATTAATGVDTKIITVTIEDSADNSSFAAETGLSTLAITAASSSYAATSRSVALPPGARRYIRASATGESGGGNASNGTLTLQLVF